MKLLKRSNKIKLKTRTIGGWMGTGTVTVDQIAPDGFVLFRKDGSDPNDFLSNRCCACRHEVSVTRKAR